MSEIEKLYENVGISKRGKRDCTTCEYLDCQNHCFISENNKCAKFKFVFPDFTAEKQILLLKWLLDKTDLYLHRNKTDFTYSIATGDVAVNECKNLEESIAELINAIWQDLTDTEKEQIRDILKG